MSLLMPRLPVAGSSRSCFSQHLPIQPDISSRLRPVHRPHRIARPSQTRDFSILLSRHARPALGKITPKRIAIPLPRDSGNGLPHASIWRPIIFCIALGGGGYAGAAWYTNSDTAKWAERLGSGRWWTRGQGQPSDREINRAKKVEAAKEAQATLQSLPARLAFLPRIILTPIIRIYISAREWTLNTPSARLVPMALVGGMSVVFLGWKVARWEPWMRRWWLHRPVVLGGGVGRKWANCVTLLTSVLSHQSLPHLAFNSIALISFGSSAYLYLSLPPGPPPLSSSTHTPHFLAFLLCAGLTSSLASHLWTNIVRLPRLLRSLSSPARLSSAQALAAHQAIIPSLGASGAIYAALTLTACAYPDSQVGIIFVPFIRMPIGPAVAGIVSLDLIGLIRGWRMFDHVAHLGGAFFGVLYYQYGRQLWLWTRRQLGLREKSTGFI